MARVKGGFTTRRRRKKVLKLAKGYFGAKHRLYKTAHEQVMHSLAYSYRDRRQVKRDMRKLWIARINAAARLNDISYSKLMHGLKLANVEINRKMLSEVAICDPKGIPFYLVILLIPHIKKNHFKMIQIIFHYSYSRNFFLKSSI